MIDIKLETKGTKVTGHIKAKGSEDNMRMEIYAILNALLEQCPGPFEYAVEMHTLELMEEFVNGNNRA